MESLNNDDDSWVSPTGLAALLAVIVFMIVPLSSYTVDTVVWYVHRPANFITSMFWVIWFIVDLFSAVCLYTIIVNVEHFSSDKNKLVHTPLVLVSMIAATMLIEKAWIIVMRIPDSYLSFKDRLNALRAPLDEDNTKRYFMDRRESIIAWCGSYAVVFSVSSIVTLILMAVDFMPNDSYIIVISLWSFNTFAAIAGTFYTFIVLMYDKSSKVYPQ